MFRNIYFFFLSHIVRTPISVPGAFVPEVPHYAPQSRSRNLGYRMSIDSSWSPIFTLQISIRLGQFLVLRKRFNIRMEKILDYHLSLKNQARKAKLKKEHATKISTQNLSSREVLARWRLPK